jgi:hypothetical protein
MPLIRGAGGGVGRGPMTAPSGPNIYDLVGMGVGGQLQPRGLPPWGGPAQEAENMRRFAAEVKRLIAEYEVRHGPLTEDQKYHYGELAQRDSDVQDTRVPSVEVYYRELGLPRPPGVSPDWVSAQAARQTSLPPLPQMSPLPPPVNAPARPELVAVEPYPNQPMPDSWNPPGSGLIMERPSWMPQGHFPITPAQVQQMGLNEPEYGTTSHLEAQRLEDEWRRRYQAGWKPFSETPPQVQQQLRSMAPRGWEPGPLMPAFNTLPEAIRGVNPQGWQPGDWPPPPEAVRNAPWGPEPWLEYGGKLIEDYPLGGKVLFTLDAPEGVRSLEDVHLFAKHMRDDRGWNTAVGQGPQGIEFEWYEGGDHRNYRGASLTPEQMAKWRNVPAYFGPITPEGPTAEWLADAKRRTSGPDVPPIGGGRLQGLVQQGLSGGLPAGGGPDIYGLVRQGLAGQLTPGGKSPNIGRSITARPWIQGKEPILTNPRIRRKGERGKRIRPVGRRRKKK